MNHNRIDFTLYTQLDIFKFLRAYDLQKSCINVSKEWRNTIRRYAGELPKFRDQRDPQAIEKIANQKTTVGTKMKSKVAFENCDSARQCLQQNKHKICGLDFFVWAATPTRAMKRRLGAILNQNMPGPSSGNVSTQNVGGNPAAESNPGSQWLEGVKIEAAREKKKRKCRRP
ncbi:hypothetical protein Ddc_17502 [Ditylenchus destructor]|nr:hypothetical protein Ddc_17502 [Ditylenchus destructor]